MESGKDHQEEDWKTKRDLTCINLINANNNNVYNNIY